MAKDTTIQMVFNPVELETLTDFCQNLDISVSFLVREAVKRAIENHVKK